MNSAEGQQTLESLGFRGANHLETLTSSVTTAWGVDWPEDYIARDLMQNFFDANRKQLDRIEVLAKPGLVTIAAPSEFDLKRLYFLGSEKSEDDVGQYGEGFKAAAVCLLRNLNVPIAAVSGNHAVVIRVDDLPAGETELYPLVYDFFRLPDFQSGNTLYLLRPPKTLVKAMQSGLTHFYYDSNPLLGDLLFENKGFRIHRVASRESGGHIFYRHLRRSDIPHLPLVFAVDKSCPEIDKKIGQDRDRRAFNEELREVAYRVLARKFLRDHGTSIVLENARDIWEQGHPLLSQLADYVREWDRPNLAKLFADAYFARSPLSVDLAQQLRLQTLENRWKAEGKRVLPGYFAKFGVCSAAEAIKELDAKAHRETTQKESRRPSDAEQSALDVLRDLLKGLAPEVHAIFDRRRVLYTVAETEAVLGMLKHGRSWYSVEVFLSCDIFASDLAHALAVFLHEHAHIFGHDGSRGFSDALTELLEVVVRYRDFVSEREGAWQAACNRVAAETRRRRKSQTIPLDNRLSELDPEELLAVVRKLPPAAVERALDEAKLSATRRTKAQAK